MISALTPYNQLFVNNVDALQTALNKVESELSSGLAVTSASDAPDQVSAILQLHANIQQNQQIQKNLTSVQSQVQTADQNLSTASTIMDQVATLASQGLGLDSTAQTRQQLATQVTSLLQQMVSISNTSVDGSYIFGGDSDQNPSYQFDPTTSMLTRLQIATATRQVQDASGGTFAIGLSANQIFDSRDALDNPISGQNVFDALQSVITALNTNDTPGLQASVNIVQSATSYLSQQQSFYGNVETKVSTALTNTSNLNVSYQKDLSNRQDADATSAIIEMQQYSTTLQAAIAAQAKMPQTNLFSLMGG
ncbi:MAG TPA: flagellin [Bryobacteraceae bacterium]|jgi:flagellar hook-associated protein 3 FlgL|nr:flagellin [Bryobacteraceae bacterium]